MPVATTTYTHSRPSYSSINGPPSPETRKHLKKEDKLILQHGSKLHSYGRDKAPYPFSYDREVLELYCMDHAFIRRLKNSVSFIDFKDDTPKHCLDLGTGLGDWVIDAAKQWTDCSFVGYDLVNVQIPLAFLDDSIADRIQWVHGNFLRQKLPFDDDEFDHVHIHGIAYAVPENKWHNLYEEVHRVLRPGGTIEVIEEDAIFPVLPRWFTAPLHDPCRRRPSPEDASEAVVPQPCSDNLPHDHVLLEELYNNMFQSRFLNTAPTSMLPSYFSAFFRHVQSPPVINFPMPPIAPMLPAQRMSLTVDDTRSSASESVTGIGGGGGGGGGVGSSSSTIISSGARTESPTPSDPFSDFARPSTHGSMTPTTPTMERTSSSTTATSVDSDCSCKWGHSIAYTHEEGTRIGGAGAAELFPVCDASLMDEHTLFIQLRRAVAMVLAAKEAMWEELKDIIERDKELLMRVYGWQHADFDEDTSRQIFDALVERYKEDMHIRISLWHSLVKHGWELPRRDALSKAEHIEDQRLRQAILDAQKQAKREEMCVPCRSMRLLVGVKVVS